MGDPGSPPPLYALYIRILERRSGSTPSSLFSPDEESRREEEGRLRILSPPI